MNAEKLTKRSLDAVRKAQSIAVMQSNSVIEPIHILAGLLKQENGLIPQLLRKMNIDADIFETETDKKINMLPKVTGSGRSSNLGISAEADRILTSAETIASDMKDEFVSVEHIMLSLIASKDRDVSQLMSVFNIDREKFLSALMSVRGNARVTSENPEILTMCSQNTVRSLLGLQEEISSTLLSAETAK